VALARVQAASSSAPAAKRHKPDGGEAVTAGAGSGQQPAPTVAASGTSSIGAASPADEKALIDAATAGDIEKVRHLLDAGVSVEATAAVCSLHVHLCSRSVPAAWPY
jgi:hypothetical protein